VSAWTRYGTTAPRQSTGGANSTTALRTAPGMKPRTSRAIQGKPPPTTGSAPAKPATASTVRSGTAPESAKRPPRWLPTASAARITPMTAVHGTAESPKTGAMRRAPAISIVRTAKPDANASAKRPALPPGRRWATSGVPCADSVTAGR
jgi:hypothetical protein